MWAQPAKPLSYYLEKCPDCDVVTLNRQRTYTLKEGKEGLEIFSDETFEMLILGNKIAPYVEEQVYYSSLAPLTKIEAYSLVPEEKTYKKYPVTKFNERHSTERNVFYHDSKEKVFLYPNLKQGAITCYKMQHQLKELSFFGKFFFGDNIRVENAELTVICPNNVTINYQLFGYDTERVQLTITQKGGNKIYHWQMTDIPKYHRTSNHVGARYYLPHIFLSLETYQPPQKPVQYFFPDLQHIFQWYVNLISPSQMQPDSAMRALTDSLLTPLHSDIEKVKSIYYWVQDNIKYVAFEEAYEGYIPRNPSDVFQWRYGDCKDMAFLLYTMLKPYHLHVMPAWVGTRSSPYKHTEFQQFFIDDHLINVFEDRDGKLYFLDPTSAGLSIRFPSEFIQGKQCMAYQSDEAYRILDIPVVQPQENKIDFQMSLSFWGDKLIGKGTCFADGYRAQTLISAIQNAGNRKLEKYAYFFSTGSNKFKLDTAYSEFMSREEGFKAHYTFNIPNYITTAKEEVYINLNLEKELANSRIEPKYIIPLELDYLTNDVYTTTLEFSTNYKLEYLPESFETDNEIFSAGFIYEYNDNVIHFKKYLIQKMLIIPVEWFGLYNETVDTLCKMYKQCIVLKKN